LQLGIHWGDQVRYVTSPLETLASAKDVANYPVVTFDQLLDS
jgi:hypothetical protein